MTIPVSESRDWLPRPTMTFSLDQDILALSASLGSNSALQASSDDLPATARTSCGRDGHRHLQIGRMLHIDLISEPPPPRCMYPKWGNLCGQRGRKRFIASWGLRMSHICPCTPCPPPPPSHGIGQRSKVVILPSSACEAALSPALTAAALGTVYTSSRYLTSTVSRLVCI